MNALTFEQLVQRDLEILGTGARYLMGEAACCAVCGKPANLSDKTAGKSLKVVDNKLESIPLCAEHVSPIPVDISALATVPETEIRRAWQGYLEWWMPRAPNRYFVVHPLSFFVAEPFQKEGVTCVAVIDSQTTPKLLGVFPVPLTEAEIANPFFATGGKIAADCVSYLKLAKAGKLEMLLIRGNVVFDVNADALPVIDNPIIREVTK